MYMFEYLGKRESVSPMSADELAACQVVKPTCSQIVESRQSEATKC